MFVLVQSGEDADDGVLFQGQNRKGVIAFPKWLAKELRCAIMRWESHLVQARAPGLLDRFIGKAIKNQEFHASCGGRAPRRRWRGL